MTMVPGFRTDCSDGFGSGTPGLRASMISMLLLRLTQVDVGRHRTELVGRAAQVGSFDLGFVRLRGVRVCWSVGAGRLVSCVWCVCVCVCMCVPL